MFSALTVYCFAAQVVNIRALPISESKSTTGILPRAPPDSCNDINECRTLSNIIWGCLATVFACTWIAIHLNIPGPDEGYLKVAIRKLGIMVLAVIAPEFVVVWAMRQWLSARRIAKEHKRSKTHGFFALMGGFVRYNGADGPYILSPNVLKSHLRKDDITDKSIQDRSKGDALSKGFAILQTGWFILQCIARQYQHLPVTELEVVTLAFAILNFATCGLWWNKPLDVWDPFVVRDELGEKEEHEGIVEDENLSSQRLWDAIRHTTNSTIDKARKVPGVIANAVQDVIGCICHPKLPAWSADDVWNTLVYPIVILLKMAGGGDESIGPESKQVPMFYSGPDLTDAEADYATVVGMLFTTVFGATHCLAWSFDFPTPVEQLLWRISSLAITFVPIFGILLALVNDWMDDHPSRLTVWLDVALIIIPTFLVSILYIVARITLLVLASMSLRSLPSDAYRTVNWTTFIPHI